MYTVHTHCICRYMQEQRWMSDVFLVSVYFFLKYKIFFLCVWVFYLCVYALCACLGPIVARRGYWVLCN